MNSIQQAKKIHEVCVFNAKAGKTATYREVLKHLGYATGVPGHATETIKAQRTATGLFYCTIKVQDIPLSKRGNRGLCASGALFELQCLLNSPIVLKCLCQVIKYDNIFR